MSTPINTVAFGMHRGMSFRDVLDSERRYCAVVASRKGSARPEAADLIAYIEENGDMDALQDMAAEMGNTLVGFGKHVGVKWRTLVEDHPDYSLFLFGSKDVGPGAIDVFNYIAAHVDAVGKEAFEDAARAAVDGMAAAVRNLPMEERGAIVVDFGKHKGTSFRDMVDKHGDYCAYMLGRTNYGADAKSHAMRSLLEYAVDAGVDAGSVARASDAPRAALSGDSLVDFGRHKGTSFRDMVEKHPDYCSYLLSVTGAGADAKSPGMRALLDYAVEHGVGATSGKPTGVARGDGVVEFGKHKGTSFPDMVEKHPDYCTYMLAVTKAGTDDLSPAMRAFIDYVVDYGTDRVLESAISKKRRLADPPASPDAKAARTS